MEELQSLVAAAEKEVTDVTVAKEESTAAKGELDSARDVVSSKQAAYDAAQASVATEKGEAVSALRAIAEWVNTKIAELEA